MTCEGRGIRGENDGDGDPSTPSRAAGAASSSSAGGLPFASPSTSNAWADFIQEEGVNLGAGSNEPAGKKRKKGDSKSDQSEITAVKADIFGSGKSAGPVDYDLSALTALSAGSKKKKGKSTAITGSLVQAGTLDSTYIGRKKISSDEVAVYHLAVPSVLLPKVAITKVCTSCNASHAIAIDDKAQAYGWGRNEGMVLGADPYEEGVDSPPSVVATPQIIATDIESAALGKAHTIFLQTDGTLHALGQNKSGQCGWRPGTKESGTLKACVTLEGDGSRAGDAPNYVKIACGEDFSMALDEEGHIYTTGSSEFGQLGNGETGEYFVAANKLAFANCYGFLIRTMFHQNDDAGGGSHNEQSRRTVPIPYDLRFQDIAAGKHHCLALEAPSKSTPGTRVFSWGSGSYGCLGHNRQKDEYYPRLVTAFPRGMSATHLAAGSTCSMVLSAQGHVYYWGKHRNNAEAVMQPRLVDALANNSHIVTHMAAGASTVACTTTLGNTVVWGQGPYGELGLRDKKSSSKATFVESLSGLTVSDLACGAGTILYVIKDDKSLPQVDLDAVEAALKI